MPDTIAATTHQPFRGYRASEDVYDELNGADGTPRPHWRQVVDLFGSWQPPELAQRWEQARRLIRDNGVTYNIHDDKAGVQRPWVLDPIPLVISADDWSLLEVGINQRARVLDALLADLYGPQHAIREGILPAELVFTHPGFLRCCHGLAMPGGRWLHLYAAVITRNRDGQWMVLGDRTGVPHGIGYSLENRLVVSRLLPGVFQECNVERLAPFFLSLRAMLDGLAPNREQPRIALQSPGPASATYFEDAYLARYLGYPLVEGGDLAVRDGRVSLKTLGGLVPMDVLFRRVLDRECDPLQLDSNALAGTPGLVQAVRQGRVATANALGTGFVESPALQEFLPALAERLLGEEMLLPAPRTWWCGKPENLVWVLASLDDLVIEPVATPSGAAGPANKGRIVPALLDKAARAALAERINARPSEWVGRTLVQRSIAPSWNGSEIVPASVLLRCFAVAGTGGYFSMRGGLARFSTGEAAGEESISSGHGSKDVWVLAHGPVQPVTLLPAPGQPVPLRRSGNDLPSRVADHLFWLGRHVERAEGAARLLRTVAARVTSENNQESDAEVAMLLSTLADPPALRREWLLPGRDETPAEIAEEIRSLVYDESRPASACASLRAMWQMASVVRDRISIDSWKILSRIRRDSFQDLPPAASAMNRLGVTQAGDVLPLLDTLILDLSAFAGLGNESMTRGPGWLFLDMGRRVERASNAIALLRETIVQPSPESQRLFEMLLEIADSSMTYRNRYLGTLETPPLVDLLVIDETNPRSIGFQVAVLDEHVGRLPRDESSPVLLGEKRATMAATSLLRLADVTSLSTISSDGQRTALAQLLNRLDAHLRVFTESLTHHYLVHATPRRRLGDVLEGEGGGE